MKSIEPKSGNFRGLSFTENPSLYQQYSTLTFRGAFNKLDSVMEGCVAEPPVSSPFQPHLPIESPPAWVDRLLGSIEEDWELVEPGVSRRRKGAQNLSLTSVRIDDALGMDAETFQAATKKAYELLSATRQQNPHQHLVRVWNFIPSILEPLGEFKQRYMAFNAARFLAYEEKYGGRDRFPIAVATASGVGHQGQDLVIHGLTTGKPGMPVENPRQVPSYNYSEKFGLIPPCFSRGSLVSLNGGLAETLLVGGTASICGETTMYEEDLEDQISETLMNLNALVAAGCNQYCPVLDPSQPEEPDLLHRFRHLRVYFRDFPPSESTLHDLLDHFPGLESLEVGQADICRPGLVVEVEGTAEVGTTVSRPFAD